jgi:hypothetical protein
MRSQHVDRSRHTLQAKRFIAKRKKRNQNAKASNLSKRREDEIGKKWRGREAVYEAEGVGSRQWA